MALYPTRHLPAMVMLCASVALSACTPHSINTSPFPDVSTPEEFSSTSLGAELKINQTAQIQGPWWENLARPDLSHMIAQSLARNYDIAQAKAVIAQARAVATQTGAERLPEINATGSADKSWQGSNAQRGTSDIGASLSWEFDIFDRIGAATQADELQAIAREEEMEALRLLVSADVARAYFGAVTSHQTLKLLEDQLTLDRDLRDLLQLRLDNGVGTAVDVLQQQARVAESETLIPRAKANLAVYENRLDVLLGQAPDGRMRVPDYDDLTFTDTLPDVKVPVALLLNRPDLRAARADLVSADADIASAIAERLPQLTLSASSLYSDTTAYTGPVSLIMGSFVQPLLDWGQRKAEVERNKALYTERLAAYTQLYLEAIEDVENALVQEDKQREYLQQLAIRRDILMKTAEETRARYTQGINDYLPVISALQELRTVERNLITEQLELIRLRISLYEAIGGPTRTPIEENSI